MTKYYWVVYNKYNGSRFYYNTEKIAERLLKLIEKSLFYGDGSDWEIRKEPRE